MFFTKCGPLLLDWMRSTFFLSGLIPGRSGKQITPHYQQPADREPLDTRSRAASFSSQKPKKKKIHFRDTLDMSCQIMSLKDCVDVFFFYSEQGLCSV